MSTATDLFPPETYADMPASPKLRWLLKHNVSVRRKPDVFPDDPEPFEAWQGSYESACHDAIMTGEVGGDPCRNDRYCTGTSEHDALCNLAEANGWGIWNEEGL